MVQHVEESRGTPGGLRGPDVLSLIVVNAVVDAMLLHHVPVSPSLAAMRERFHGDPGSVVPRKPFLDELARASAATADAAVWLTIGESLNEMSFHYFGPLIASQASVRDMLSVFLHVASDVSGGARWFATREGDDMIVGYRLERELGPGIFCEAEIFVTTMQRCLVHWLGARGRNAVTVLFEREPPPDLRPYLEAFDSQVRFAASCSGVRFAAELLDVVRPGASKDVASELRELSGRWLPREDTSWSLRMRQELAVTETLSNVSFDDLAWRWGLSPRSLRRKLAAENASFTALLEHARLSRAQEMLASEEHSLREIAEQLGYWEVNSFQRAFKRWVGMTPGSYRSRALRQQCR